MLCQQNVVSWARNKSHCHPAATTAPDRGRLITNPQASALCIPDNFSLRIDFHRISSHVANPVVHGFSFDNGVSNQAFRNDLTQGVDDQPALQLHEQAASVHLDCSG
jgi:hypothetical protein